MIEHSCLPTWTGSLPGAATLTLTRTRCTVGRVHGVHGGPGHEPAARALRARRRAGGHPVPVRGITSGGLPLLSSVLSLLSSIVACFEASPPSPLPHLDGAEIVPSTPLSTAHSELYLVCRRACQTSAAQHIVCRVRCAAITVRLYRSCDTLYVLIRFSFTAARRRTSKPVKIATRARRSGPCAST